MKRLLMRYFTCGIAVLIFWNIIAYYIRDSIEVNEMKFKDYPSIPDNSGVKTWLPSFFPKKSNNIYFHSNLDFNKFGVKFFLDNDNSHHFNSDVGQLCIYRWRRIYKKRRWIGGQSLVQD
ncbi:hypothetical protein [Pseudocitrobacter corydidari]|uniref:hypothetical protein n=1 Tax=Pseudocitrobacter corydidari TaxID=2891570 RepID=UPI001E4E4A50|nr:hypothetical protein [Pseudocitrobacter corydidari]